jgi:flagellar hook-associated protein 1 FlgK
MTVAITDPKKLAASSEPAMSTATSGIVDGSTILASSTIIVNYGPNPSSPSSTDTITIPATDTTLSQVVDDINGDSSLGVTASTSTDSDGATHLVLTSKTSGTAGTINVTWSSVAFGSPTMTIVTGGNTNLTNLANVADTAVSGSLTPTEAYGAMVFQVGNTISDANAEVSASTSILQQLQQQQQSVSGVSLDEEASNLMLYQRAYEAAARAISTVDEMLKLAINMGAQR